ncbi:MAG: DUF5343 domain-containing protein [Candidatus Sulfotelmatobacter sp.]
MADKHPYISGTGAITGALNHFRKTFPSTVTAETLKKLGLAPNNESYVINILRFIGVIDKEGNSTPEGAAVFTKHSNEEFQKAFEGLVKNAYAELFKLHGGDTWALDEDGLISFFRGSDKTSDLVGRRQASTFRVLSSFAGHGEMPSKAPSGPKNAAPKTKPARATAAKPAAEKEHGIEGEGSRGGKGAGGTLA